MAVSVREIGTLTDLGEVLAALKSVFSDLEDQLNQRANIYVSTDGKVPSTLQRNDFLVVSYRGNISLYVKGARDFTALTAAMLGGLSRNGMNFVGLVRDAINPDLSHFPNPGDFGFFFKTSVTVHRYICVNIDNVLYKVEVI